MQKIALVNARAVMPITVQIERLKVKLRTLQVGAAGGATLGIIGERQINSPTGDVRMTQCF